MTVYQATITQARNGLKQKKYSAVELLDAIYQRIEAVEDKVQAYVHLTKEIAKQQAEEADRQMAAGRDI